MDSESFPYGCSTKVSRAKALPTFVRGRVEAVLSREANHLLSTVPSLTHTPSKLPPQPSQNRTCRFPASGSSLYRLPNVRQLWPELIDVYLVGFRTWPLVLLNKENEFIPGEAPALASAI